jgi:hypothetical protein
MINFVTFHKSGGAKIHVNPDHVIMVYTTECINPVEGYTTLKLVDGDSVYVSESLEMARKMLSPMQIAGTR